ncbi:hypothetical protein [Paracoccus sp. T5]|uniref:hypothetical protein n=1 Tax=Paracoccus sp. T5 TaxID=3402161 RepID=UPI003AEB6CD6
MGQKAPGWGSDFGASSSAAGNMCGGGLRLIRMAPGQTTMPGTFFFDYEAQKTLTVASQPRAAEVCRRPFHGRAQAGAGHSPVHERRQILKERMTFVEIIGPLLKQIKIRAAAEAGVTSDQVLSGSPSSSTAG